MARFIKHPKYLTGFDTANYRMIVPEGYARYAVVEGFGPGVHGEDFFKKKPKPQTGYEKNQNTFRRVDNAEACHIWFACLRRKLSIHYRSAIAASEAPGLGVESCFHRHDENRDWPV